MGVIHIAQGLKDGGLVVLLGELVIHILKLNAPAPACVIQPAQTVRVHLPEGQGILGRMGFPVAPGGFDDPSDFLFFSGGQLYLPGCRLCLRLLLSLSEQ